MAGPCDSHGNAGTEAPVGKFKGISLDFLGHKTSLQLSWTLFMFMWDSGTLSLASEVAAVRRG